MAQRNDQVRANGTVDLETSFDFDLTIKNRKIKHLFLEYQVDETVEVEIEAALGGSFQEEVEIAQHRFKTIHAL